MRSPMRFLAVFLPRLSTDRILRRKNGAKAPDAPLATTTKIKGAERLYGLDARAQRLQLFPGMPLADARAMYPTLVVEEADPQADAKSLEAIADWCRRYTPLAALDPPDGVLLDVSGAAHLFGGEAALLDDIERRLADQGFASRAALAPGPALARALARYSSVRMIPPQASFQEIEALAARLPAAALGLCEAAQGRLARAGLRYLGDLAARSRAPLAARFGQEALARLDALYCRARDPLTPRFESPDYMAERRFPEGLTRLADIEATLKALAGDLAPLLERHGVGARKIEAIFFRVDGVVRHIVTRASRPLRDPERLFRLLREKLSVLAEEGFDTGYGFDVMRLCAAQVERVDPLQATLPDAGQAAFALESEAELADLVDRLGARLGLRRVLRLSLLEAHLPECAVVAAPAAFTSHGLRPAAPARVAAQRPLRLFERPEPIDVVALTPDGPPLRFRWRRGQYETRAFEGPERIAPPWWGPGETAATRDYFYVEDKEGRRFWIFREGLYERESQPVRWFVHGLS